MTSIAPGFDITTTRNALLTLHGRLLQMQRIEVERSEGRMSSGTLLRAATQDHRFVWLGQLLRLVAALDQAHADNDVEATRDALTKAHALIASPDADTAFGARYLETLQTHPDVVFAHRDALAALNDSTRAAGELVRASEV